MGRESSGWPAGSLTSTRGPMSPSGTNRWSTILNTERAHRSTVIRWDSSWVSSTAKWRCLVYLEQVRTAGFAEEFPHLIVRRNAGRQTLERAEWPLLVPAFFVDSAMAGP